MARVFETQSYVSADAAWHQELTFDEPYPVTIVIENVGSGPVYGFYLNEDDFNAMIENGGVDDAIMSRIQNQLLCESECGVAELEVRFPPGKHFICLELDVESAPDAKRTEFKLSLHEK
jgi:hypothetical protein